MSSFPGSPKLVKGGLVILDAASGAVKRTIALQYHPDTLTRSYQVQGAGGEGGAERPQPFRLKGPAIESTKLDAEIDAPIHWSIRTRTRMPLRSASRCNSRRWKVW